ncbi:MAG: hypothetical protein JXA73_24530 [Acidobacteria bacterium]|nr:hypothetical protein [Acidobacteriota bacterium]
MRSSAGYNEYDPWLKADPDTDSDSGPEVPALRDRLNPRLPSMVAYNEK